MSTISFNFVAVPTEIMQFLGCANLLFKILSLLISKNQLGKSWNATSKFKLEPETWNVIHEAWNF